MKKTTIDQQKALRHDCTNIIEIVLEIGLAGIYFNFKNNYMEGSGSATIK